jgi:hypothetical protein
MKLAIALVTAAGLGLAPPAFAEDAHVGVGVGPAGAGVTVGSDHRDHDREKTVIKKDEPRDRTTVIKKEHEEPENKTIIRHE